MPDTGQKDQSLITGRIAYGYDGINAYPLLVDTSGRPILGASTAAIGKVDVRVTETIQTELLAIQSIAASTNVASTVLSLIGVKKATFFIDHARAGSAAFGTNGTEYRIEVSQKASGNETWVPVASVIAGSAVAMTCASSGNYAIGAGTITILSGTALVLGDRYFWINGTASSCEWMKVSAISGTASFNILDPLTNAQVAASTIVGGAERWPLLIDTETLTRVRVIVNNNASGTTQAIYSRVACITEL